MLFAFPSYQFPYVVMNRCFYLSPFEVGIQKDERAYSVDLIKEASKVETVSSFLLGSPIFPISNTSVNKSKIKLEWKFLFYFGAKTFEKNLSSFLNLILFDLCKR